MPLIETLLNMLVGRLTALCKELSDSVINSCPLLIKETITCHDPITHDQTLLQCHHTPSLWMSEVVELVASPSSRLVIKNYISAPNLLTVDIADDCHQSPSLLNDWFCWLSLNLFSSNPWHNKSVPLCASDFHNFFSLSLVPATSFNKQGEYPSCTLRFLYVIWGGEGVGHI